MHPVDAFTLAMAEKEEAAGAIFSEDGRYRYALWRVWDWEAEEGYMNVIGLNPSTADAEMLDPTCRRCANKAIALGYGGYVMTNLFALKSTDPRAIYERLEPVGHPNDSMILSVADRAGLVLCAWGAHGYLGNRGAFVERMLRRSGIALHHLGLTQGGHPRHPLYLPNWLTPQPWVEK